MPAGWKALCAGLFTAVAIAGCASRPEFAVQSEALCPHHDLVPTAGAIVVACHGGAFQAFDRGDGRIWRLDAPRDYDPAQIKAHRSAMPATHGPTYAVEAEGGLITVYPGYGVQLRSDHNLKQPTTLRSDMTSWPNRFGLAVLQGDRIEVWAPGLRAPRFSAPAHDANNVVLSDDGKFLMTYTKDSPETPVRVFDASGEVGRYAWSKDYYKIELLDDGIVLFEGSNDETSFLLEAGAGGVLHRAPNRGMVMYCAPAGGFALFMKPSDQGTTTNLWNMRTGEMLQIPEDLPCTPRPDKPGFVVVNPKVDRLELLDPASMKRESLEGNVVQHGGPSVSDDGSVVMTQGESVMLQSLKGGLQRVAIPGDPGVAQRIVDDFAANGSALLANIWWWDAPPNAGRKQYPTVTAGFLADRPPLDLGEHSGFSLSRDGSVAVVQNVDGHVRVWDLLKGEATDLGPLGSLDEVQDMNISPDGRWIVVGVGARSVLIRRR